MWILRAFLLHAEKTTDYVQYPKSIFVLTDKIATSKSEIYFQNCVTKHSHSPKTGPKYAGRQASNFAIFFISKKKVRKIKKLKCVDFTCFSTARGKNTGSTVQFQNFLFFWLKKGPTNFFSRFFSKKGADQFFFTIFF